MYREPIGDVPPEGGAPAVDDALRMDTLDMMTERVPNASDEPTREQGYDEADATGDVTGDVVGYLPEGAVDFDMVAAEAYLDGYDDGQEDGEEAGYLAAAEYYQSKPSAVAASFDLALIAVTLTGVIGAGCLAAAFIVMTGRYIFG